MCKQHEPHVRIFSWIKSNVKECIGCEMRDATTTAIVTATATNSKFIVVIE